MKINQTDAMNFVGKLRISGYDDSRKRKMVTIPSENVTEIKALDKVENTLIRYNFLEEEKELLISGINPKEVLAAYAAAQAAPKTTMIDISL